MNTGESRHSKEASIKPSSRPIFVRNRFAILLGFMVLYLLALPVLSRIDSPDDETLVSMLFRLIFAGMLLAAVFAVAKNRRGAIIATVLALPALAIQLVPSANAPDPTLVLRSLLGMLFLSYVALVLLRLVFTTGIVTVDTICASICVYLLLGIVWSIAYTLLEAQEPGSFRITATGEAKTPSMEYDGTPNEFPIYYSFVTMTTLGYGDIVPTRPSSRMLTILQALTGQIYLVVLVARLVGLHISHSSSTTPEVNPKE